MEISKPTYKLAKLFSEAIRAHPNDPKAMAMELKQKAGPQVTSTILELMSDPESELSIVLAAFGNAFHSGSGANVPENVTADDIPAMARKIRIYI